MVIFEAIVLCELDNLSAEPLASQPRDRLSFLRFLGLGLEARVPDTTTVWLNREQLVQAAVVEEPFSDPRAVFGAALLRCAQLFNFLRFDRLFFAGIAQQPLCFVQVVDSFQTIAGVVRLFFLGLGLHKSFRLR